MRIDVLTANKHSSPMGSCIFAARGLSFDVAVFLETSNLKPGLIYHKGEAVALERQPCPDTGFVLTISQDDSDDLQFHFKEALRFLNVNEGELKRIRQLGAEDLHVPRPDSGFVLLDSNDQNRELYNQIG